MPVKGRWVSEFKVSLICRVSSRTAKVKQRYPVLRNRETGREREGGEVYFNLGIRAYSPLWQEAMLAGVRVSGKQKARLEVRLG